MLVKVPAMTLNQHKYRPFVSLTTLYRIPFATGFCANTLPEIGCHFPLFGQMRYLPQPRHSFTRDESRGLAADQQAGIDQFI